MYVASNTDGIHPQVKIKTLSDEKRITVSRSFFNHRFVLLAYLFLSQNSPNGKPSSLPSFIPLGATLMWTAFIITGGKQIYLSHSDHV